MKLKIPPAIQVVISAFLMWIIKEVTGREHFQFANQGTTSSLIFALGAFVGIIAVYIFRKAKTTATPLDPSKASALVTNNIYTLSRNPMYVGMLIILFAFFIKLGTFYNIIILILYVWYITTFQIKPEEKTLSKLFGKEYETYRKKVRRWL